MNEHIVLRAVCTYHRVTPAALLERTKVASIVWLRHELIYLLRSHTNLGWLLIGKFVGGRDQATVKNSVEQVTERILSDQTYAAHVENLSRFVQQFAQPLRTCWTFWGTWRKPLAMASCQTKRPRRHGSS